MAKKRKEKEFDSVKAACAARREEEIAMHGKQISLRRGGVHKSVKDYNRKREKKVRFED